LNEFDFEPAVRQALRLTMMAIFFMFSDHSTAIVRLP
jgi:hypothetical protein